MSTPLGQINRLTFKTYSDADKTTLADATTVTLYLKDPTDGTISTPTVSHVADSGIYTYDLPDDTAGLWQWRWVATGDVATSSLTGALSVNEAWPPALIGLDDARSELNFTATTDDDELQGFIYTASAVLLNHPAYRVGDVSSVTTYTEWDDAGIETFIAKHYPITAVTSITEYSGITSQPLTQEPIDGGSFTSYGWDYEDGSGGNGMIVRLSSGCRTTFCGNRVKVVYTAGSASVPWDVRQACLSLIDHLWESQQGGAGADLAPGYDADSTAGTFGEVYGPAFALPNRVKELLEPYKKAPAVA